MPDAVCHSWEAHLESYLLGDFDSLTPLYKSAKDAFLRFVRRRAPFMPDDVREEVFDQIFVRLLDHPPAYDLAKCSLRSLMYGLARNALKQVRAMYAPPGQKTRISVEESEFATIAAKVRPEELAGDDEQAADPTEEIPSHRWTAAHAHAMVEASELLSSLPEDQASALWLVHGLEYSNIEAGVTLRKSRFAIGRLLRFTQAEKSSLISSVLESAGRSNLVAA